MFLACNWKTYITTREDAEDIASFVVNQHTNTQSGCQVVLFPPPPYFQLVQTITESSPIAFGAQDIQADETGAHTGEISADALTDIGAAYTLVGHSETRKRGITDAMVKEKLHYALAHRLRPILCVSEKDDPSPQEVSRQLLAALGDCSAKEIAHIIVAYEPTAHIGGDAALSTESINETVEALRKTLRQLCGPAAADIPILYGGSVSKANIADIMKNSTVQGVLVGRASVRKEDLQILLQTLCQ